ncbi:MAG: polysaccharide lyase family 7 protein [Polyangiaceae bacterium]
MVRLQCLQVAWALPRLARALIGLCFSLGACSALGNDKNMARAAEPSAGPAGSAGKPLIDFSIWQLQLPTGSGANPDTVSPQDLPAYSSAYFKRADDGGYVLMDPKTGITTSGSQHPRTELREGNATGGLAAWASSGTNTLTVSGKVMLMSGGAQGSTTVAQVFVSGSNTLLELQYNGSQFKAFYEESKGNPEPTVTLGGTYPLNTKYTFIVAYSANVLTVNINGKVLYTKLPSSAVSGKRFYFKVGNYDQTADPGTPSTTPYTQLEEYKIDVVHS